MSMMDISTTDETSPSVPCLVTIYGRLSRVPSTLQLLPLSRFQGDLSLYGDHTCEGHKAHKPYRVTLLGNRVPFAWSHGVDGKGNAYAKLSPEMMEDLGFLPPDYTFGSLWRVWMDIQDVDAGRQQMALHTRAAVFGFDVAVVNCKWQDTYGIWNTPCTVCGIRIVVKLGEDVVFQREANGWRIPHAFHRAHLCMDAVIAAKPAAIKQMRPRHWHQMASDFMSTVIAHPDLCGRAWDREYIEQYLIAQAAIVDAAAGNGCVALDLEDVPPSLATIGAVDPNGSYIVIIEEAPFRTLGDVCAEKCTLLTWSDTEAHWLASQNIALTNVEVMDLQKHYLRNDENLMAGSRYDEDSQCCVPTRDRRPRPIEQAMAMHRTSSDPLYVKSTYQDKFFYPHGKKEPTIWASRPLADEHVGYAAGDVVSLLVMAPAAWGGLLA